MIENGKYILSITILFIMVGGCIDESTKEDNNSNEEKPFLRIGLKNFTNETILIQVDLSQDGIPLDYNETILNSDGENGSIDSIYWYPAEGQYKLTLYIDEYRNGEFEIHMYRINTNYEYAVYQEELVALSGSI